MSIYLGADAGTTSTKCLALSEDGRVLALAQQGYGMAHPHDGWAEQEPEQYWQALVGAVRACVEECARAGRRADEIQALALSAQGNTLILTDEAGQPVSPAISWMDSRAGEQYGRLMEDPGAEFLFERTWSRLTPLSVICKLLWLKENEPDIWRRRPRVGFVPDYLARRLTGRAVMDAPSASWTPLYDPAARKWADEALAVAGVDEDQLPDTALPGSVIGEITPEACALMGLPAGACLKAGAFDQAAAALGAGASAGSTAALSCGTAWVLYAVSRAAPDPGRGIPICCHTGGDEWGMVLPFSGGSTYDWARRTFKESEAAGGEMAPAPVFVPHLYGGLAPDWLSHSRGGLFGLTMAHTGGDIHLAAMRALALEARRSVQAAEALTGGVGEIVMVGGATHSGIWPQMTSDLLQRTVSVPEMEESACAGAAILAGAPPQAAGSTRQRLAPRLGPGEADEMFRRYLQCVRVTSSLTALS